MNRNSGLKTPVAVLVSLCAIFGAFLAWSATQLPDQVATHFGLSGYADKWSTRESAIILMACLGLLLPLVPAVMSFALRYLPVDFINIPHREYWLAPERREATYGFFSRYLLWLSCLLVCFVMGMHWLTIQAHHQFPVRLPPGAFVAILAGFLVAVAMWAVRLIRHFRFPRHS